MKICHNSFQNINKNLFLLGMTCKGELKPNEEIKSGTFWVFLSNYSDLMVTISYILHKSHVCFYFTLHMYICLILLLRVPNDFIKFSKILITISSILSKKCAFDGIIIKYNNISLLYDLAYKNWKEMFICEISYKYFSFVEIL